MEQKPFSFIFLYDNTPFTSNRELLKSIISKRLPNVTVYLIDNNNKEKETESIKEVHMITMMTHLYSQVPFFFKKYPMLKWVHSLLQGIDMFMTIPELVDENNDIIFSSSRGTYSDSLTEFGVFTLLYFNFHIATYFSSFNQRQWNRPQNIMVKNKTLLIMGYGKNGISLAKKVKDCFNMHVIGVIRKMRENVEGKEYCDEIYEYSTMSKDIINKSDFIFATLPHTKSTIDIFNKEFFNSMKKSAVFINIGRGSAVVEEDLIDALNKNVIRGAVLDVTKNEPLQQSSPLYQISKDKLLITNHSGGHAMNSIEKCYNTLCDNIDSYIKTGKPLYTVNKKEQY